MQAAARFPLDLTELSIFRTLKDPLGGKSRATHFFWLLWRDLAQLALEGMPLGRFRPANTQAFAGLLVEDNFFPNLPAALAFIQERLVNESAGLLHQDGEDLVCPRFINLNPDLAYRPRESRGGHGRSFSLRQRKMSDKILELGLGLNSNIFVRPGGDPLDGEMTERIQRLVYSCDNALKRDRPDIGWTEGLVTLAIPVVETYSDRQIEYICRKVALSYGHSNLVGMTTEKLLPKFGTICSEIGED